MNQYSHQSPRVTVNSDRDRGNVLPMVLVMMVVGSLMVTALLTFAITILRNQPPLEERSDSLEAVRSAMRMAIVMQRDHGPDGCYESSSNSFDVNGRNVTVQCQSLTSENDNGGRLGLIATTNNGEVNGAYPDNEPISIGAGNTTKEILGSVFVNGGQLGGDSSGLKIVDGELFGSTHSSAATSAYRYDQVDLATELTFDAATTCADVYGSSIQSQVISAPSFDDATAPLISTATATGLSVAPDAVAPTTRILGVFVHEDATNVRLVREPNATGGFDVDIAAAGATLPATACFQDVADTDPTFLPRETTTCDSPLVNPEQFSQDPVADGITCDAKPWWSYAGWKPQLLPDYIYPSLPQVPTYPRSSVPVRVGVTDCYVFYPGRYNDPIVLDDGKDYYFASGVYLINNTMTISGKSQVVAGEGTYRGCAFDADAAFLSGSPRDHQITGRGATFLLGSDVAASDPATPTTNGRIELEVASLRINRRVATTSTRGSSGISIMSVNVQRTATGPDDVEIPQNDRVLAPTCLASEAAEYDRDPATSGAANPCLTDIATYSITPTASIGSIEYSKSGLGPDDAIIEARLNGGNRNNNRLLIGGSVFVPNAKIDISRSRTDWRYQVRFGNGVVASSFAFDLPGGGTGAFLIGAESQPTYQKVRLVATTHYDGGDFSSVAELEVDAADRYAINNWTVEAD